MISTLKKRGDTYYCSNCLMWQFNLRENCVFCGNSFSNFESVIIEQEKEKFIDRMKEDKNEGNLRRTN